MNFDETVYLIEVGCRGFVGCSTVKFWNRPPKGGTGSKLRMVGKQQGDLVCVVNRA